MQGLERPVFRRRRRWATLVLAIAIPANVAALYALLARPDSVTYSVRIHTIERSNIVHVPAPPIIVPVPTPTPQPPAAEPRACPAPNHAARSVTPPDLPAVDGVYASPTNADWIVAWNEASIYASIDGGRSFAEVLLGSGRVHSVALDCFGNVIAARGTRIGVREHGRESWHDLPGIELAEREYAGYPSDPPGVWIVGGGPDLVVVGFASPYSDWKSRAAISHDRGRSWSYRDLGAEGFEGTHLAGRQLASGRIELELEIVDCSSEWMETFTIDGVVTREDLSAPDDDVAETERRARLVKRDPWRDPAVSTDAAGRRWTIECGQLAILATNERPTCSEED